MEGRQAYITDILDTSAHHGDFLRGVWHGVQVTIESLGLKKHFEERGYPGYYAVSLRYPDGKWGCIHGASVGEEIVNIDWEL